MKLFEELKRRNVFRVGAAYAVVAWLLLQVADLVLENIAAPEWVMQVLLLVMAVGFPLALLLAWAFELTPTGLQLEADVDRSQSITPQTGKRIDRVIIGVLIVIVAVMAVERFWFADHGLLDEETQAVATAVTDKSIAVLPFVDLSEAQDQGWFAKGLADEILNALMRAPDLLVASRTSAFKYLDSDLDIRDIAAELGVAHIVEGSIRRSGESIRVTAQLIRASDGFHVWSQNYDRKVSDVIAIQEDLAISIARALETGLDPVALEAMMAAGTRSVEAYEHFLNGLAFQISYFETSDLDKLLKSYEEFERARSIDPRFAKAHAEAAGFWQQQLQVTSRLARATDNPILENLARFETRIRAAIDSAPNEVMRWEYESSLADIHLEFRKQKQLLRRVLEARPNYSQGWSELTNLALRMSDFELASEAMDRQMEIYEENPDPATAMNIIIDMHRIGRLEESTAFAKRAIRAYPGNIGLAYQAHRAFLWANEVEAAAELLPVLADDMSESYRIASVRQACAEDRRSDAERLTNEFVRDKSISEMDLTAWHMFMVLGRIDEANELVRANSNPDVVYPQASWLFYRQFDPRPFPELMALLDRENVHRGEPLAIPFACS